MASGKPQTGFDFSEQPHRRLNPLTGEWILVSPHRVKRPWQGKVEHPGRDDRPHYDPGCYLCPGNARAGTEQNPQYSSTFVFDNDFSALRPDTPRSAYNRSGLIVARGEPGRCRVVCFSPRHDLTLAEMETQDIRPVVDVWIDEYRALSRDPSINYIQLFENKGELMGCSNPHPHSQIWAEHTVPVEPLKEMKQMRAYRRKHRRCLLCDYLRLERSLGERVVVENDQFTALVPFWAVWPFETLIVGRRHFGSFLDIRENERDALADIVRRVTCKYDNLFNTSFPYSSGFHQSPVDGERHPEWHFHMHFLPPLLRSATVKKFMVGYEMLANPQRDLTAEASAATLRALSEVHFRKTSNISHSGNKR